MQSTILKTYIFIFFIVLLISGCNNKTDLENQITIKITFINKENKQPRIDMFDTIIVRKEGFGFIKTFDKIGECVTDSLGSVRIKIDKTQDYMFSLKRRNYFGSETFARESLKNGQEVNIEVFSTENR
jgi:hypothetical protein